jgi:hypothetical protein
MSGSASSLRRGSAVRSSLAFLVVSGAVLGLVVGVPVVLGPTVDHKMANSCVHVVMLCTQRVASAVRPPAYIDTGGLATKNHKAPTPWTQPELTPPLWSYTAVIRRWTRRARGGRADRRSACRRYVSDFARPQDRRAGHSAGADDRGHRVTARPGPRRGAEALEVVDGVAARWARWPRGSGHALSGHRASLRW